MKKSLIAFAVAGAVALPSIAAAELKIGGDARYRMNEKTVKNGVDTVNNSTDSRIRMVVQGEFDGGVKTYVRFDMHERDNHDATNGFGSDSGWMSVPLGPVTIRGGRVRDDWGNRFGSWDNDFDQVDVAFKAGMADISIFRITNTEGGTYDKELGEDANDDQTTGVDVVMPVGGGELGLRFASDVAEPDAGDVSGSTTDIYFKGKIGPGMLLGEYVSYGGEYWEDVDGDSPTGLYLHWIQKFGGITGEIGLIQANNFYPGENNFALFSTVGTAQDTAHINVGGIKEQMVVAVKGTMGVAKDTTVTLGLGSITGKATDAADDGTGTAVDLVLKHKVSKKTTVMATYGTISLSEELGDTTHTSIGANMSTKF